MTIIKRILIIIGVVVYVSFVVFIIYELNRQNEYVTPTYINNTIFSKGDEAKLNGIGYKIENINGVNNGATKDILNKVKDKKFVIELRVANYNKVEFLVERNQFTLSDEEGNVYSETNALNKLDLIENNSVKSGFIGKVKANNVQDFEIVFNFNNKEITEDKKIFLNVSSKLDQNKSISFDLTSESSESIELSESNQYIY